MEGTEQGNPGIYIQADEWQETYGGNVFVVDEVTGRMYVLRGDTLERIPEVASCRRRDELSPKTCEGEGMATGTHQGADYAKPVGDLKGSLVQDPHTQIRRKLPCRGR